MQAVKTGRINNAIASADIVFCKKRNTYRLLRANILQKFAQNSGMSKRKNRKLIGELMDECVSANECTGLLQKVSLDPDEVEEFHKMYNGIDGRDST